MICNYPVWSDDTEVFDHYNKVLTAKNKEGRKEIERLRFENNVNMFICLFRLKEKTK